MDSYFQIGDVVMINSDGPYMTVAAITVRNEDNDLIHCSWFIDGYLNEADFDMFMIQRVMKVSEVEEIFEEAMDVEEE